MTESVFKRVDQQRIIGRLGIQGGDIADSQFFGPLEVTPGGDTAFREGLLAFTGQTPQQGSRQELEPPAVRFSGDLVSNQAACMAFIRNGPAGVQRV